MPGLFWRPPAISHRKNRQAGARVLAFETACSIIGLVLLWALFAPLEFGGEISYVIVHGTSMTPRFKEGDLVIVRRAAAYQVGDIVTYTFPDLGRVVHRIVGRDGLRYIIKGDANSWLDSYHPDASEILGKQWVHLPGAGRLLLALRSPGWVSGLVFVGVLMVGVSGGKEPGRKMKNHMRGGASRAALRFGRWVAGLQEAYYVLAFTLGLGAFALGAFAFTRPTTVAEQVEIPYEQIGLYAYMGDAPEGVYDQSQVKSGDAVFPQVTCKVHMIFNYHLLTSGQSKVTGRHHFTAVVSDGKGWSRTVELQPQTEVPGGVFQAEGDLNFCEIRATIARVQELTGAVSTSYQVTVSPHIEILGAIEGVLFEETFSPELVFTLDPNQISLISRSAKDQAGGPLQSSEKGLVTVSRSGHNFLSIFNLKLSVLSARWLSAGGLLAALLLLGWVLYINREAEKNDPRLLVELLSGQPPVEIQPEEPVEAWKSARTVRIGSLRDLARLANSLGALIELVETPERLYFMFNDQGTCYQTVVENPETGGEGQVSKEEPAP